MNSKPFILSKTIENDLNENVNFRQLIHDQRGCFIIVESKNFIIEIFFNYLLTYKMTYEVDFLSTIEIVESKERTFIFELYNSMFLNNFNKESFEMHTKEKIKHFVIFTNDECFDVITYDEPQIKIYDFS